MNYSISVALQIWHPLLTCNYLQTLFYKSPDAKHSVGDSIIRKDGKQLSTKYVDSYICYNIIPLQDFEELYDPIKEANNIVLNILKDQKSFLELKKTGGRIIYYCAIYTKEHIVFSIPSEISKEVANLEIDIVIEVFQNYTD